MREADETVEMPVIPWTNLADRVAADQRAAYETVVTTLSDILATLDSLALPIAAAHVQHAHDLIVELLGR